MHLDLMRDPLKSFPNIPGRERYKTIRVWYCKYSTLAELSTFERLEEVVIASFPDRTLEVFARLKWLRYLSILHMPKISDLAPLGELGHLESLSLSTSPAWDAAKRCTFVKDLHPIGCMRSLKHLELFGVCSVERSLLALEQCKGLKSARFSQYPENEVSRFYSSMGVENAFNPKPSFESDS